MENSKMTATDIEVELMLLKVGSSVVIRKKDEQLRQADELIANLKRENVELRLKIERCSTCSGPQVVEEEYKEPKIPMSSAYQMAPPPSSSSCENRMKKLKVASNKKTINRNAISWTYSPSGRYGVTIFVPGSETDANRNGWWILDTGSRKYKKYNFKDFAASLGAKSCLSVPLENVVMTYWLDDDRIVLVDSPLNQISAHHCLYNIDHKHRIIRHDYNSAWIVNTPIKLQYNSSEPLSVKGNRFTIVSYEEFCCFELIPFVPSRTSPPVFFCGLEREIEEMIKDAWPDLNVKVGPLFSCEGRVVQPVLTERGDCTKPPLLGVITIDMDRALERDPIVEEVFTVEKGDCSLIRINQKASNTLDYSHRPVEYFASRDKLAIWSKPMDNDLKLTEVTVVDLKTFASRIVAVKMKAGSFVTLEGDGLMLWEWNGVTIWGVKQEETLTSQLLADLSSEE